MKLDTNFARPVGGRLRATLILVWLLSLALLGTAGGCAWQAAIQRAELPQLRAQLAGLQRRAAAPVALPPAAQLAALQQRIAAINALAGGRRGSLPALLAELEQRLPEPVWLLSLHYTPRAGGLALVAEAGAAEPLTQFLLALEQSPRFERVMLTRQTPKADSVQFEVHVVERRR